MPRLRRRSRERVGFNSSHVFALWAGRDFFAVFAPLGERAEAEANMAEAWPALRLEAIEFAKLQRTRGHARIMPAAFWLFESKQERSEDLDEVEQLQRMLAAGILAADVANFVQEAIAARNRIEAVPPPAPAEDSDADSPARDFECEVTTHE
jgi:hypothetical protein